MQCACFYIDADCPVDFEGIKLHGQTVCAQGDMLLPPGTFNDKLINCREMLFFCKVKSEQLA